MERRFEWCRSVGRARTLAALFARGLTTAYISHGELQGPRAVAPHQWAPDIDAVLEREIVERAAAPLDAPPGGQTRLAAALSADGEDVGVFLVTFSRAAPVPFAIIEDMVVAPQARGRAHGDAFMRWLEQECAARGVKRLFLESGGDNEDAHRFFEREGFRKVSIVMMRDL